MALTLLLLEQIMQSEVENIHARIDEHRTLIDKLFDRLDSIDRQLSLLWLAVEDLKVDRVTKTNLDAALANYATKADVHSIVQAALADYPTKADVQTIVETTVEAMFAKYFPAPGS
jgi:hypothetical protein